jgi:hypothetical protein
MANNLDYQIIMNSNFTIVGLRNTLARRLTAKIAEGYRPEFRDNLEYRYQELPNSPGNVDLIIKHKVMPQAQMALEFYGSEDHLKFHVRDSVRDVLTPEYACNLLDSMPDIVCKVCNE